MDAIFFVNIRGNTYLRTILKPILAWKNETGYKRYKKSDDANYIKTLRNINEGRRCFIIGNGPSLTPDILNLLNEEITFACNKIYDIFPYVNWRPTYYMCVDKALINDMQVNHPDLSGLSNTEAFCVNREYVQSMRNKLNIHQIYLHGKFEANLNKRVMNSVSEDVSDHFSWAQSAVCSMLELAFYMGIKEIYLVGVDHNFGIEIDMKGNKVVNRNISTHFKEHKDQKIFPSRKEALTKCYEVIKDYADAHGIIIKNATQGSKLEVFDKISLNKVLKQTK